MSEYRLSREERETILLMNDRDNTMEITSWAPAMVRKLRALAPEYGVKVEEINYEGVRVTLPKKALTLRKPRNLSPEQKRATAERLRNARLQGQKQNAPAEMNSESSDE